jgi:phosphatidylinositol alpha-1,6-mannosyltransferase
LSVDHERFSPGDRAKARRRFRIPEEKRVILSVSRLWRYKGHDVVLRALSHLSDEIQERFIYVIAGKGPDEESLRHEANRLNLDSVVRWLGYVPEDDLPDLYRCADLFVLCTRDSSVDGRIEGFGLVFLEAQACGVPVVGTRSGGIPDAVEEDEGGWLIAQDADNELADILQLLASDPLAFAQMGRKGRSRVEREMTLDGYITRMRSVLSSHGIACY